MARSLGLVGAGAVLSRSTVLKERPVALMSSLRWVTMSEIACTELIVSKQLTEALAGELEAVLWPNPTI